MGASAKGLALGLEDDRPDAGIRIDLVAGGDEVGDHRRHEGVPALGRGEGDHGDVADPFEQDLVHRISLKAS